MESIYSMKFWMDLAGWLGASLFLVSYGLLILKRWKSNQTKYHLCNVFGAILLCMNTWYDGSYPSVAINLVWGMIAIHGYRIDREVTRLKAGFQS